MIEEDSKLKEKRLMQKRIEEAQIRNAMKKHQKLLEKKEKNFIIIKERKKAKKIAEKKRKEKYERLKEKNKRKKNERKEIVKEITPEELIKQRCGNVEPDGMYLSYWMGIVHRLLSYEMVWDIYLIGYYKKFNIESTAKPNYSDFDHLSDEYATSFKIQSHMVSKLEKDMALDSRMMQNVDNEYYWDKDDDFEFLNHQIDYDVLKIEFAPNSIK